MIVDSVLINTKAYLKGEILECSIAIEEGKFFKIGRQPQMPSADQKIDLHGMLVLPGLIDEHVHLRDEERAYKEDFITGTSAAAAGGFTTVLDMPNNQPVTNSVENLKNRMEIAERRTLVNLGLYSEFPKKLVELQQIKAQGAVGFKLFMGNQIGSLNIDDDQALKDGLKTAGETGTVVAIHAEDKNQILSIEQRLKQAKHNDARNFLLAHTEQAEVDAMKRLLRASEGSKVHMHFCHVTSQQGLEAIKEAKKDGKTVTCEVTPNHLMLSSTDVSRYGMMAIMAPPLREVVHQEALRKGVTQGDIDAVGSDHAPHTLEEKSARQRLGSQSGRARIGNHAALNANIGKEKPVDNATNG